MEKLTLLFEKQELVLKSGFVGGLLADKTGAPMGMYLGNLGIENTNLALVHLLRAVIKLNVEEQNMNIKQSEAFIKVALNEAVKREAANKNIDNVTLKQQQEILLKMRRDH